MLTISVGNAFQLETDPIYMAATGKREDPGDEVV